MENKKTIDELVRGLEKIDARLSGLPTAGGPIGQLKTAYNPHTYSGSTALTEDPELGSGQGVYCLFGVIHTQEQLGEPITFLVPEQLGELSFLAASWYCMTLSRKARFSPAESVHHPLVLSWRKFLKVYLNSGTADTYHTLIEGQGKGVDLEIADGLDLLHAWIDWLEKYATDSPG